MEVSHVTLLLDDYNALMKRLDNAENVANNTLKFSVKEYNGKKYIEASISERIVRDIATKVIAKDYPDFRVRDYFYISEIEVSDRLEVEENVNNEEIAEEVS